jgi:hypothetical protein
VAVTLRQLFASTSFGVGLTEISVRIFKIRLISEVFNC